MDTLDILRLVAGIAYITDKTRDKEPTLRADADRLLDVLLDGLRPRT